MSSMEGESAERDSDEPVERFVLHLSDGIAFDETASERLQNVFHEVCNRLLVELVAYESREQSVLVGIRTDRELERAIGGIQQSVQWNYVTHLAAETGRAASSIPSPERITFSGRDHLGEADSSELPSAERGEFERTQTVNTSHSREVF